MEVVASCPKCRNQYGWNTEGVKRTPDGGTCPAPSPNCPECGYDVTGTNERSKKDLHWFAQRGDTLGMKQFLRPKLFGLIPRGPIDPPNVGGMTPLMIAAMFAQEDAVVFLLDQGANPNAKHKGGATALDIAEQYSHPKIAEILKRRGATASGSLWGPSAQRKEDVVIGRKTPRLSDKWLVIVWTIVISAALLFLLLLFG